MRVLLTGGGTAGHINPALSIAAMLRREDPATEVLFVGAAGRMETVLVPQAGYALRTITVEGFRRQLSLKNIGRNVRAAYHAVTAGREAARIIREFAPDIAIGTGGYVCGPVLRQAARLGVPVLLHESNALPGVTVKLLAADAAAVMVANEEAAARLPKGTRAVVTGNPLRRELTATDKETARRELGVDDRPLVLCFGGSLGARRLNEAVAGVLARNQAEGRLQFLVGTGRGENYETMQRLLREKGVEPDGVHVRVRDYIDDMPRCMAAADLVICRCGAMTLSELPALGKPSVLVPSPNVAENHQYYNAMALASRGAAVCVQESELTEERLWHEVSKTALAPDVLARMGAAARQAAVLDADERILAVIRQTLAQHTR